MSALPVDAIADAAPSFGSLLRAYRMRRGLFQRQLAALVGVDRATINDYESGRNTPRRHLLARLVQALRLDDAEQTALVARLPHWPVSCRGRARAGVGRLLRMHREAAYRSQNELAGLAGLHASALNRIETGDRKASAPTLLALARGLELDDEDTDRLMVAGGHCPPSVAALGWDATLAAVCRVLLDDTLPDGDLATFRAVVESIAGKWARVPRHPALVEG